MGRVGKTEIDALERYQPGGGGGAADWFKPQLVGGRKTQYTIRYLPPYKEDMEIPFVDRTIHYFGPRGQPFLSGVCPRDKGGTCMACDWFFATFDDFREDKDLREGMRNIQGVTRMYANIVFRGMGSTKFPRSEQEVLVWGMSFNLAQRVLENAKAYGRDGIDITDPDEGRDVVITLVPRGNSFRYSDVMVAGRKSKIGVPGWEDKLFDLEAKAEQTILTAEQVEEALPKALGDLYDTIRPLADAAAKGRSARRAPAPKKKAKRKSKAKGRRGKGRKVS